MKESNFSFLTKQWPSLYESAVQAEQNAITAPRTSAFYARYCTEQAIQWIYDNDPDLIRPYQDTLSAMMHEQTFKEILAPGIFGKLQFLRKLGNVAVHSRKRIDSSQSIPACKYLFSFLNWLVLGYGRESVGVLQFDDSLVPTTGAADKTLDELNKIQQHLDERDRELKEKNERIARSEEEIQRLKEEMRAIKEANHKEAEEVAIHSDYSEAETRKLIIDIMLIETGWDPKAENVEEYEVTGMPNDKGIGYADYVLWGDDGLPLAVIEAKRTSVDPAKGKRQVKLYADCLEEMHGQRPVIFYTNGYDTNIWDDTFYPPRIVQGFYEKDELQLLINRRTSRKDIRKESVNKNIAGRYYQENAIRHVAETFSRGARGALLVMATGSGKTRVSIAAVELLMKGNWVKRVLFLADRTALVKQAKRNFNEHLPNASLVNLVEEKEGTDARIVFSTYPTIMNAIDGVRNDDDNRIFGVGHFDLIIIDEAHRSVYQKYRAIFEYFDALILGLTATPKAEIDHNTYQLFGLEDHMPTFAYELDQAVKDGYLVPPVAITVPMKFQREGIKYDELSEEEKAEYEEEFRDEHGNMPEEINSGAINKWLFNIDTVDKVLAHLMEQGIRVKGGDKLGKTIIFAKNHNHAEFIVERFNNIFPEYRGDFLQIIDNQVKYAQNLIEALEKPDKEPTVAVSVDMLDTGIDIPDMVNLVFFKIVRSKAKFWQMIGRGTRLRPDIFGPENDKQHFFIFDFCDNFAFFGENPDGIEISGVASLSKRIFDRRLQLSHILQAADYQEDEEYRTLYIDLLDTMHHDVNTIDQGSFLVQPHRRYLDRFIDRSQWDNLTQTDISEISNHLAHLPNKQDEDELAKRFDFLILNLQIALHEESNTQVRFINKLVDIAGGLEKKANVPKVKKHIELIRAIQTDEFIENINIIALERVREALRELIEFLEKEERKKAYTNFEDEFGEASTISDIVDVDINLRNYRQRFEKYIREHKDHITINKLRMNKPITETDINELERILFSEDALGSREDFEETFGTDKPLSYFIRSMVGLDRAAAKEAFSEFQTGGALTPEQMSFIDRIINELTSNGFMEPDRLFETPFTDIHPSGVVGLFPSAEVGQIVQVIQMININAGIA